ncbi:hypothetical protein ACGFZJ_09670 [Streptomyces sp. NPDC048253]|uniref:AtuA-related protein n=1 Tax=unclassified Streptomyces TaxID=2593676 RepID=UPI0006BB39B2|nr:hypothetical protein OV320_2058 [Actinobacteria bacterium OV320]
MLLQEMAHARSGDKGDISDISVIAYNAMNYPLMLELVTAERVQQHFAGFVVGDVRRYELPQLHALKFVLDGALDGGVTRSLNLDIHGKCLSSLLLGMELGDVREPSGFREFE